MDRVQLCLLLTSFQEGPYQKLIFFFQNSASKITVVGLTVTFQAFRRLTIMCVQLANVLP